MIKHLLRSLFVFAIISSSQAQTIPWFFSTHPFNEWVQEKRVKEIVALYPEFQNFESYNDYISTLKYQKNTALSQVEVHYCFDSLGEMKTIKVALKKIHLSDSDYQLEKFEYNRLYGEFENVPYSLSDSAMMEFQFVKGLEDLNIKAFRKYGSLIHNEEVISIGGKTQISSDNDIAWYSYRLLFTLNFDKGLFQSSESYYPGSADTHGLPYYSKTWFDQESDNVYILKEHSYFPEWTDHWGTSRYLRDTIVSLPYYRNTLPRNSEGESYLDTLNVLILESPSIEFHETRTGSGSEILYISKGSPTLMSLFSAPFFDANFNYTVGTFVEPFWQIFHSEGNYLFEDYLFTSHIPKGEYLSIRNLDKNGSFKSDRFYNIIDGKKELLWNELKTENGYLRVQKIDRQIELRTYYTLNHNGTFDVIENKLRKKHVIDSKTRLEFTDAGFEAEQNGSTKRTTYKVMYYN